MWGQTGWGHSSSLCWPRWDFHLSWGCCQSSGSVWTWSWRALFCLMFLKLSFYSPKSKRSLNCLFLRAGSLLQLPMFFLQFVVSVLKCLCWMQLFLQVDAFVSQIPHFLRFQLRQQLSLFLHQNLQSCYICSELFVLISLFTLFLFLLA